MLCLFLTATVTGATAVSGAYKNVVKADTPETTFELLGQGETLRYNGASKPTYTYNSAMHSGTISFTSGDKRVWFNLANTSDYVIKEDGSIEKFADQTLRLTVSFSDVTAADANQNYWVGLTLIDGDVATGASSLGSNYYILRHQKDVSSGKYMYQAKYGTFSGGGNFLGDDDTKYALTESDTVMALEIKCGEQLKGWLDGKEITDNFATYNGTALPNVGLWINSVSVSYTISAELIGVKGWANDMTFYDGANVTINPVDNASVNFDMATKSGTMGGTAGAPVANGTKVDGYFEFAAPDKVVLADDSYAAYSTVKQISVSATFSNVIAGDGTFDASNMTEAVGLKFTENNQTGWLLIAPVKMSGYFGAFHPTFDSSNNGVFERASGSGISRFTSDGAWSDNCVGVKAVIIAKDGVEDGSITIYVNGTLAKTIG